MKQEARPTISAPNPSGRLRDRLEEFQEMALAMNRSLNLYSRASTDDFWGNHILHSLTIATRSFPAGSVVVDWGTGGGLPGIPLAACFPEVEFILIDSVSKKIRAVRTVARRLGLDNVTAWNGRAEDFSGECHFAVSRATASMRRLWEWTEPRLVPFDVGTDDWQQGLLALKGGNLRDEIGDLAASHDDIMVSRHPLAGRTSERYLLHATRQI